MPQRLRAAALLTAFAGVSGLQTAQAWILSIAAAPRRVFLHVGNGALDANVATINLVQVTVPATQLGSGAVQAMSTDSTQSRSLLDNYSTCPTPASQILIGASYRRSSATDGPASATLSVTAPNELVSAAGERIAFSQIRWQVSAPGSSVPNVIRAGSFLPGTQTLATVAANTFIENCHSFEYLNTVLPASGTYNGRVTYTLSSP
jgi:hypothetical protein